ncbi:hypothetical protein DPMN_029260 [Dreissena polymorpha]|uniref:Uncharacterized protein n=1 Tax=Dreissena polymorpha TaxID=45954 RepID=A0A9D4RG30_DREPO|nr:hypothetical protein DPMN_029260 [Dreissena polymorpha]
MAQADVAHNSTAGSTLADDFHHVDRAESVVLPENHSKSSQFQLDEAKTLNSSTADWTRADTMDLTIRPGSEHALTRVHQRNFREVHERLFYIRDNYEVNEMMKMQQMRTCSHITGLGPDTTQDQIHDEEKYRHTDRPTDRQTDRQFNLFATLEAEIIANSS